MKISVSESIENIMGNRENAGNQYFLLFPKCFTMPSFLKSLKVGIVWGRVKQCFKILSDGNIEEGKQGVFADNIWYNSVRHFFIRNIPQVLP